MKRLILFLFLGFSVKYLSAQLSFGLVDGRNNQGYCGACKSTIEQKPREVLFGIDILPNGDVYFNMRNRIWFDKIFSSSAAGITVDLVSRDRYDCDDSIVQRDQLIKGTLLRPIYKSEWQTRIKELEQGNISIRIGKVPANLINKELEGNLIILNGNQICYYTNFINIERTRWALLPMGMYTDSLVKIVNDTAGKGSSFFTYSKKLQVTIPFAKNKTTYKAADLKPMYDSLKLKDFIIRKIDIRAYASIEGPEKTNLQLMKGRAESMVKAFKQYQPQKSRINITTAENWMEFLQDIRRTRFSELAKLPKVDIKKQLLSIDPEMDSILARHRKAIVIVYLERKTSLTGQTNDSITKAFQKEISAGNIDKARMIQKEIVERIIDNRLPNDYLDRLEVPRDKIYLPVLSDKVVFNLFLQNIFEDDALNEFLELRKLDPHNGRLNYNICALRLTLMQFNPGLASFSELLGDINNLPIEGIDRSLVKRLLINYHILKSDDYMKKDDYKGKDSSITFIRNQFKDLQLNDDEIFSIAKYLSYYAHKEWAEELIEPRVDQIDVSEDLVFYYINLGFYHYYWSISNKYNDAILNAINLNRKRFCDFFRSIDKGGAGMQLLEYPTFKKFYCESCTVKSQMMIGKVSYRNEVTN